MNRLLLRALNAPILILLVAIGIAVQTSIFAWYPLNYLQPDVVLLVVVWVGLRRSFTEGGVITLILANISEIHSAAPQGLFFIVNMVIYLLVRGANVLLVLPNLSSWVGLTLAASLLWKGLYLGVLYLMGEGAHQWRHTLVLLFPGAVTEGALAIWAYRWLEQFDWVTFKSPRAQRLLEDELQLES